MVARLVGSSQLKPGEVGAVMARLETHGRMGPVVKSIDIVTNDPIYPVAHFEIRAHIVETHPAAETPGECK